MNITVRPAGMQDIPRMVELLNDLFLLESDFTPDREKQRAGLICLVAGPEDLARVLVADGAGMIIGMASVQVLISTAEGGPVGMVEDVIVDRQHRGMGVGTVLLEHVVVWSKSKGLRRLQLLADVKNENAISFYEKRGWQRTGLSCWRRTRQFRDNDG
jgi:GNAT superfamily N-acetyltransferase